MIAQYLGFDSDYIIIGLAALVVILMILMIVNVVQMSKLKKNYKIFMTGKNAKTLVHSLQSLSCFRKCSPQFRPSHPNIL